MKDISKDLKNNPKETISLSSVKANVHSVEFKGLRYTKHDYVKQSPNGLFKVENFQQLLDECHRSTAYLQSLGVFKEIRVEIDTSSASDVSYVVRFQCKELPKIVGQIGTEVEANGFGSGKAELALPNFWGRGEKLIFDGSKSLGQQNNLCFKVWKPFFHTRFFGFKPEITANIFRKYLQHSVSFFDLKKYGVSTDLSFVTTVFVPIRHTLEWETSIREIFWMKGTRPPANFYFENGPKQVSTIRYKFTLDCRDRNIFPRKGVLLHGSFDVCGFRRNANYFLNCFSFELTKVVYKDFVGQITGKLGFVTGRRKPFLVPIDKLFYFGGSQTLRGFEYGGAGPRINGITMGVQNFWATGLHLWGPIPFRSNFPQLQDHLKTHLFFNCGGCSYIHTIRSAFGIGIALNLSNICRFELNYTFPLSNCVHDRLQKGFKFFIGNDFI